MKQSNKVVLGVCSWCYCGIARSESPNTDFQVPCPGRARATVGNHDHFLISSRDHDGHGLTVTMFITRGVLKGDVSV